VPVCQPLVWCHDAYRLERDNLVEAAASDYLLSGCRDKTNCPEPGVIRTSHPESVSDRPFFDGEVRIIFWPYHIVIN